MENSIVFNTPSAKRFSQACENNKLPILQLLQRLMTEPMTVVEIGSGTGQHGAFFSQHLPHIQWQPTDLEPHHASIEAWRESAQTKNLKPCITLDVKAQHWPITQVDGFFSANTAHIMSWEEVLCLFSGVGTHLCAQGLFCLYGPFSYNGAFTSQSNADFDQHLKANNPKQGIRSFEALQTLASQANLNLIADHKMPANNRLLVWQKVY